MQALYILQDGYGFQKRFISSILAIMPAENIGPILEMDINNTFGKSFICEAIVLSNTWLSIGQLYHEFH